MSIKEYSSKKIEFREIRDLKGLEVSLNLISAKYSRSIVGYAVYIYQPKEKAYYKKMILTNSDIIKSITKLQGSYLDDQEYINDKLLVQDFILLDQEEANIETSVLHNMGLQYLLIRRLISKDGLIGEIHILLNKKPTNEEIRMIQQDLAPLNYVYIL